MIIFDTNIWYRISEGKIDLKQFDNEEICLTALVLIEIMSSPRWITQESEMKRAVETIINLNPTYIELLHYEFIAKKVLGGEDLNSPILEYSCLERSLNGEINIDTRRILIEMRKEITTSFVDNYNKDAEKVKNNPELLEKMKEYETFRFEIFNDILSEIEKTTSISRHQLTEKSFANLFENIEIYAWSRYTFYYKTTIENKNVRENDLIDLMNLFYVKNGDKYLTQDRQWQKYIPTLMKEKYLLDTK